MLDLSHGHVVPTLEPFAFGKATWIANVGVAILDLGNVIGSDLERTSKREFICNGFYLYI